MIKNKIKKITVILTITLLTLCNFSCVFAEENNNKEEIQEIKPRLLTTLTRHNYGRALNFDRLNSKTLNYYYNNYNNMQFCLIRPKTDNFPNALTYTNSITNVSYNIDHFYITFSNYYQYINNGQLQYYNRENSYSLYQDSYETDNYAVLKFEYENNNISLKPYKLTINNIGKGTITNSINYEPYASTNIYYEGQEITLTYDNQYDDFNGWYINGTKVSDDLNYTFNITSDITIGTDITYYDIPTIDNVITWISTVISTILAFNIPIANGITLRTIILYLFFTRLAFQVIHMFLTKNHFWEKNHKSKGGSYGKDQ